MHIFSIASQRVVWSLDVDLCQVFSLLLFSLVRLLPPFHPFIPLPPTRKMVKEESSSSNDDFSTLPVVASPRSLLPDSIFFFSYSIFFHT